MTISAEDTQSAGQHYAFVMNASSLVGTDSFTLAPGHELRRASTTEISTIKEVIIKSLMHGPTMMPWEQRTVEGGSLESMPEAEWRYFVISFQGSNHVLLDIEEAFSVARAELKIGFTVLKSPGRSGLMFDPGRLFHLLEQAKWGHLGFIDVTASDVEQIVQIHTQLEKYDRRLVDVKRFTRQLQDLEALPPSSPLRFLGYFAVLEALLTHLPNPTDPYESITRQIKKKVSLLDHRWQSPIEYSSFAGEKSEKIWKKMYDYRSVLAHGGAPAFDDELQILKNHDNALKLLKQTVKAVIRQALVEPQLLADLRDC
jgi:hypothetical protein